MASTSETGHAKNVANFEDLISFCKAYGTAYNPSREQIKLASLQALRNDAVTLLAQVKATKVTFDNATNARQLVFKPLRTTVTRLVNALAASGASKLTLADARVINRKLQGVKAPSTKAAEAKEGTETETTTPAADPAPKSISVSQQSYDSLIDHLEKLIELAAQEPTFAPNEADINLDGLAVLLKTMKGTNTAVIDAYTMWSNTRIRRRETLYNALTGLVPVAQSVKLYIKSLYGASSPQYKQVSGLQYKIIIDK